MNAYLGAICDDVWLRALPQFHVGGFAIGPRAVLAGSNLDSLKGSWDSRKFADAVRKTGATLTSLVPTQLFDLVESKIEAPGSLRCVLIGGGAFAADLKAQAEALGWPIRGTYGMTEAGSQIATQNEGGDLEPLPCWHLRVDDDDVLSIRGDALFSGYLVREGGGWRLEEPFDDDGWFRTSDLVRLRERTLEFVGRSDRCVKILGELVNLDLLEALLGTSDAALVALPDARRGSKLILVCEEPIAPKRLENDPATPVCVACAEKADPA